MITSGHVTRNIWTGSALTGVKAGLLAVFATTVLAQAATGEIYRFDCDPSLIAGADAKWGADNDPALVELRANVATQIARLWNLGSAEPDALRSQVVARLCFDKTGSLISVAMLSGQGPSREAVVQLYDTALRAVNRAQANGGISLPLELYDSWRVLDLVFDANRMTLR